MFLEITFATNILSNAKGCTKVSSVFITDRAN